MQEEPDRLALFRALRAEIRGASEYLVVGIDVAKDKHHAFYGTASGRVLRKRLVFDNRRTGFEALRALARDLAAQRELSKIVYGLEPTGVYHKPLLAYLQHRGEQVVLVSNVAVARNRELLDGRWDKNDLHDAANVADLVGQGRCLFADFPEEDLRELRTLVRVRARLKKQEHGLRMRVRNNLVAQYFPELAAAYAQGSGANDAVVLAVVGRCFDPRAIAALSFDAFWARIARPRWGKAQESRVRAVWEAAPESVGCPLDEAVRWEASWLAQRLEAHRTDLGEVEQQMLATARRLTGHASVISVPGVGPILAAMIQAAIGNPHRFEHVRQVLRLAGLDLCASRSGKQSDQAVPRISKQGKASLRFALVHAAMIAARSHPAIRAHFSRLLQGREQERGIRRKMYVKLAARLLGAAWHLMKQETTFAPERFLPHLVE